MPWTRDQGADAEAEPDWAQGIRDRRKARGDRLREVFATFEDAEADDDPSTPVPTQPQGPSGPTSAEPDP